jgi:hypothetical protein
MFLEYLGDLFTRLRWPGIHRFLGFGLAIERRVLDCYTAEWGPVFPDTCPPELVFQMSPTVV